MSKKEEITICRGQKDKTISPAKPGKDQKINTNLGQNKKDSKPCKACSDKKPKYKDFIPDKSGNYDGIMYTNTFRVNHDVFITGVSFFGPKNKDADYSVNLEITQSFNGSRPSKPILLMELQKCCLAAKQGEKFRIDFPSIKIDSNKWIDFRFRFEGPETERLNEKELNNSKIVDEKNLIEVEFLRGSKQMSDIHFVLDA